MSTTPYRPIKIFSRPLEPTKQLPPTPNSAIAKKQSFKPNKSDMSEKRARQRVMFTPPHSSSDGHVPSDASDGVIAFKVPPMPAAHHRVRLMTPSSSTVAASSSPPRMSSPSMGGRKRKSGSTKPIGEIIEVDVQRDNVYVFGRHRHHDVHTTSTTSLPSHITSTLSNSSAPVKTVFLPRTASHASRLHAVIEYVTELDTLKIIVLGQNGVTVRATGLKRKLAKGQSMEVQQQESVRIDFHGCMASLRLPIRSVAEMEQELHATLFAGNSSPMLEPMSSLPPSSPPMMAEELDDEDMSNDDEEDEDDEKDKIAQDRSSSPLSCLSDNEDENANDKENGDNVNEIEHAVKAEALEIELAPAPQPRTIVFKSQSRAPSPVKITPPVPEHVDLPALIVSTIVFSGSSKLSLPDLVKHMLESQPSFNSTAPEETWYTWVGEEVESNPMFGKVSRVGKDSSGHPLLPHYFYLPDQDPDVSRAQQLGNLGRPLRTVQRAGGRAIDWRPVGSGRRRY